MGLWRTWVGLPTALDPYQTAYCCGSGTPRTLNYPRQNPDRYVLAIVFTIITVIHCFSLLLTVFTVFTFFYFHTFCIIAPVPLVVK
jgi:hypothetical protein